MVGPVIAAILGLAGGFGIAWLIIRKLPQDKIREINYARLQEEEQWQKEFSERKRVAEIELQELDFKRKENQMEYENRLLTNNTLIDETLKQINALEIKKENLSVDITHLNHEKNTAIMSLNEAMEQAAQTAEAFKQQQFALAIEQLDRALEESAAKYQQDEEECKQSYLQAMQEYVAQFQKEINIISRSRENLQIELNGLQHRVRVAVEAAKREEEKRTELNYYKLILPESDLEEIAKLRQVEPYLRDKEALNKVIWKVYYEKPCTDMIGRVLGAGVKTGIYKLTNTVNQMCYVGQAVNVAERWKQHIKRGLGAETPTRNKLYPAMAEFGVETFTFELLEECPKDKLDQQEDYWQDFFHAKDYGYSIK